MAVHFPCDVSHARLSSGVIGSEVDDGDHFVGGKQLSGGTSSVQVWM